MKSNFANPTDHSRNKPPKQADPFSIKFRGTKLQGCHGRFMELGYDPTKDHQRSTSKIAGSWLKKLSDTEQLNFSKSYCSAN